MLLEEAQVMYRGRMAHAHLITLFPPLISHSLTPIDSGRFG